jgi:hypothetical protein
MAKAATMPIVLPTSDLSESGLTDETLRDMCKTAKGFRREYPGEPWVFMAEQKLFAVFRVFASSIRADERRRCLRACRGAVNASDARSRIRALPTEAASS